MNTLLVHYLQPHDLRDLFNKELEKFFEEQRKNAGFISSYDTDEDESCEIITINKMDNGIIFKCRFTGNNFATAGRECFFSADDETPPRFLSMGSNEWTETVKKVTKYRRSKKSIA